MSGVGGYVRRCERRPVPVTVPQMRGPDWLRHSVLPSGCVFTWRLEPPAFQCMPVLKFEEFGEEQ